MNGLAIFGAVMYHAAGWGFVAMFWWADQFRPVQVPNFDQFGSFSYYGLRLIEQLIIFSIPVFLFVSGYFIAFACGKDPSPKWGWIFTRLKFLIIPYLVWSILMIIMNTVFGQKYSLQDLILAILTGKAVAAFYFIPLLVQLYLLSPFLTKMAKSKPWLITIISFLLMLFIHLGQYASLLGIDYPGRQFINLFLPSWVFPGNLFWVVFGMVIGFHYKKILPTLVKWKWVFLSLTILLIPLGMWEWEKILAASGQQWLASRETFIDTLYSIVLILSFLSFGMKLFIGQKWLNDLGSKSFGIYLAQTLFLTITAKAIYQVLPSILQYQILLQPILIASAILGPLVLMWLVKKTVLNKYYVYIFG